MRRWCASPQSSFGMTRARPSSTARGVGASFTSPIRLATRKTWGATAMAGSSKATATTTLAVLRPTPLSRVSSACVRGTSPPKSSTSIRAVAASAFAFWLGYETERMYAKISSASAPAIASGVGKRSKRAGVTRFTRASVHCADRITATRSSKGLRYWSSVSGRGIRSRRRSRTTRAFSFRDTTAGSSGAEPEATTAPPSLPAAQDERDPAEDGDGGEQQPERDRLAEERHAAKRRKHGHAELHRRRARGPQRRQRGVPDDVAEPRRDSAREDGVPDP